MMEDPNEVKDNILPAPQE